MNAPWNLTYGILGRTARLPTSLGTNSRNGSGDVSLMGLHIEHHEAQDEDYNF